MGTYHLVVIGREDFPDFWNLLRAVCAGVRVRKRQTQRERKCERKNER